MHEKADHRRQLIRRAHEQDKAARDQLVAENTGLVWSVVKHFEGRGSEKEDLFQIGVIGLLKAIDKFDLSLEVQFSTYAVPMIIGEIQRFLRDDGTVKVSRVLKEEGGRIRKAEEHLRNVTGRDPTLEEISEETGLPVEEITLAVSANARAWSIDHASQGSDGGETFFLDRFIAEGGMAYRAGHAEGAFSAEKEQLFDRMMLEQLLEKLDENDRKLIELRYFGEKTQTQVAAILGISQVQVSRRESKIIKKLRALAREE
ncbi:MAG: SigB/SigF/SigG family RNA polymerase sigma factor [Lachnospiraceae bacterium]|nr:SigB/SigF/SigG family RNA polymerase sigma factor [Lachnospiraceae bacterium]